MNLEYVVLNLNKMQWLVGYSKKGSPKWSWNIWRAAIMTKEDAKKRCSGFGRLFPSIPVEWPWFL